MQSHGVVGKVYAFFLIWGFRSPAALKWSWISVHEPLKHPGHWGRRRIVWFQLGLVGICGAGRSNLPGNCQAGAKNMLFVGYLHWHKSTYHCGFKRQASILKDAFAVNSCGTSHADSLFVDSFITRKYSFIFSVSTSRIMQKNYIECQSKIWFQSHSKGETTTSLWGRSQTIGEFEDHRGIRPRNFLTIAFFYWTKIDEKYQGFNVWMHFFVGSKIYSFFHINSYKFI